MSESEGQTLGLQFNSCVQSMSHLSCRIKSFEGILAVDKD